jgi:hypothetical protein
MTDQPRSPEPDNDNETAYESLEAQRGSATGLRRWVKVVGIVVAVVVVLIIVMNVISGGGEGGHGPGRHSLGDAQILEL